MSIEWPANPDGCLLCGKPDASVVRADIATYTVLRMCQVCRDRWRFKYQISTAEVKREPEAGTQSDSLFPVAGP